MWPATYLVIAFALWCSTLGSAWAQDFIVERAVLQDRSGGLSINDVVNADFTPTGPILNAGYTTAAHWLRLRIQAPDQGQFIELRIRPTYLDEVLLYEPDSKHPGQWVRRVTGDKLSYTARDRPSTTLGFTLTLHAPLTTVYLRLQTTSNSLLTVEALTAHEAYARGIQLEVFLVIYLGFMVALLFWAANDFALRREPVVGWFLVQQLCYSVYALAITGFIPMLFPQAAVGSIDSFTSAMVCMVTLMSLLFHRVLLGLFAPPRLALRVLELMIFMSLSVVTALALGYTGQALQFNAVTALLIAPVFVVSAFLARRDAPPGLRVIRLLYSLQSASLLAAMLPFLGWISATEWSLQATLMNGFISAFLMFLLMHLRSHEISRKATQTAVDLRVAREQLAIKKAQQQQQERFVAMLTHELKTPIAVIRMALGKLQLSDSAQRRAQRALSDMTGIVDHCQLVDQLEQQQLVTTSVHCNLAEILAELKDNTGAPQRLHIDAQGLPCVCTDPQLLRIVLGNLMDNAFKYADPDSTIRIQAQPQVQSDVPGVRVTVRNQSGLIGLPDADKVFEKYYRSPGAYRKTGSGLGLYLVKSYMHLLGGQVSYAVVDDQVEFALWIRC